MGAYKDKNGTWYAQFRFTNWKGEADRKTKRGFATKKEALEWEREFLTQNAGSLEMTFEAFYELYKKNLQDRLKKSTWKMKTSVIESKILPHFKKKRMCDIKPKDVVAWQNTMLKARDAKGELIKSTDLPPDASPYDFRDPKIERWGNGYRMTVASKSQKGGQLLGFYSEDLQNWRCLGVYADGLGGMAECPDIFALDGKQVVVVCLMDYEGGDMPNNNPVIYLTGKEIDGQFKREGGMRVMDWGLDFYAPQTMYTPDGRRVMIGWAFRWGNVLPTHTLGHGWAGTMTLPRECVFEEGKLIQKPVKEIENRRASAAQREPFFVSHWIELPECAGTCREIHLQIDMKEAHAITIHLLETEAEYFSLNYDKHTEFLMADRSKCGYPLTLSSASDTQSVTKTPVSLKNGILDLRIFVDVSIVEIYVNGGENVMTYLAFPKGKTYGVSICAKGTAQILQLESFEMA